MLFRYILVTTSNCPYCEKVKEILPSLKESVRSCIVISDISELSNEVKKILLKNKVKLVPVLLIMDDTLSYSIDLKTETSEIITYLREQS